MLLSRRYCKLSYRGNKVGPLATVEVVHKTYQVHFPLQEFSYVVLMWTNYLLPTPFIFHLIGALMQKISS